AATGALRVEPDRTRTLPRLLDRFEALDLAALERGQELGARVVIPAGVISHDATASHRSLYRSPGVSPSLRATQPRVRGSRCGGRCPPGTCLCPIGIRRTM